MTQSRPLPQDLLDQLDACVEAYLGREGPLKQSGHNGTYASWKQKRGPILQAVDADGDFLDVGCANGYLLECLVEWGRAEKDVRLRPHGVDYGAGLIDLARQRLPEFCDNLQVGNMWDWQPPQRYDYVCTGLSVPDDYRDELFDRFVADFVKPGGRLILRRYYNRDEDKKTSFNLGHYLAQRGYRPTGTIMLEGHDDVPLYAWIDP
ncbi:MAG: SAM-dependent methyltransferase [Candidatus Latescibacteria bacterium]|nr:SAM-dependent methyltransferase [Candidatus Latescibacterota bacterium]